MSESLRNAIVSTTKKFVREVEKLRELEKAVDAQRDWVRRLEADLAFYVDSLRKDEK